MLTITPTFDGKRTIPSVQVTAVMLDLLQLRPQDNLLEIGTGSSFQTRKFAETGAKVHSIELEPWIDTTISIGDCVFLHQGDAVDGCPMAAPYTAIVATCGVEQIPKAWTEQLSSRGRLVAPVGDASSQRLTLFRKEHDELVPERVGAYVRFQMLREQPKPRPVKPRYDAKVS